MNMFLKFISLAVVFGLSSAAHAATTITFDSLEDVNAAFPAGIVQGGSSFRGYDSVSGRLQLHAEGNAGSHAAINANAYSDASFSSSLDFITAGKTITFNDVTMGIASSGTSYTFALGIGNAVQGNFSASSGPSQRIYFFINRADGTLSVKKGGVVLQSWSGAGYSFDSLSLSLTATGWSASVVKASGAGTLNASGTFATALDAATWGDSYYLGLHASQTIVSDANYAGRYTNGFVGSIDITPIPEPASVAVLAGAGALLVCGFRRSRSRRR